MRRVVRGLLAAALALTAVGPVAHASARPSAFPASNRLFLVSDSVGLGAIPQMKSAFGPSWQVTVTGKPGLFTEQLVKYVTAAPAGAFGESAIVATGYNYPYWDSPRFATSIDQMVAALKARGVTRIYWVTVREVKPAYYSHWGGLTAPYRTLYLAYPRANQQLRDALARHPELSLIDWAAIADRTGITADAIHLNLVGANLYAGLARATVVTGRTRSAAGKVITVPVAGTRGIAADASAVSMNVSVVNPRTEGSVSVYACDLVGTARPVTLWYRPAQSVAGGTLVPLGPSGTVCVVPTSAAHVRIDVNGWFPAASGVAATPPRVVADTRHAAPIPAGTVTKVRVAAVAGAPTPPFTAVVGLTQVTGSAGEVRVYTCGNPLPAAATRSFEAGVAQSVAQLVRTDANGDVCVRSTATSKFVLSLLTAFDGSTDVRPVTQRRLLDTRTSGGPLAANVARAITVPYPTAGAAWFDVTLVGPTGSGSVLLYPCAAGPSTAPWAYMVPNHGQTNAGMSGVDATRRVCVRSSVATHVIVDVSGWSATGFRAVAPFRVLSTLP